MTANARRSLWLCLLAFWILASYECVRPAAESLFIEAYTVDALPYVWIAVPIAAALAVTVYNRFAARVRLMRLMGATALISALLFVLLTSLRRAGVPGTTFALYVLKDVYIVILVEIFWSYANSVFPIRTARWIYGLFCMSGSLGGAAADWVVGRLSESSGSMIGFACQLPVLLGIGLVTVFVPTTVIAHQKERAGGFLESISVVRGGPYLGWLMLLIATTQVAITLIDFSYNAALQAAYPDTDARTGVISNVYFAINLAAIGLQLATGPILRLAGVPFALLVVPLLLGSSLTAFILLPRFILLAATKVMSKCLDYSLFRAAKEILYIPLTYAQKTQGKSLVDMLTYRVAKGGASLLLIVLATLEGDALILWLTLGLITVWILLTWLITRRYREAVDEVEAGS